MSTVISPEDRRRARRLIAGVYGLLNSGEWQLRYAWIGEDHRLRDRLPGITANTVGYCDPAEQVLYVDYHHDVLATIVHECLHALYPDKNETEVRELECLVMRCMSPCQARRLHRIAAEALSA